MNQIPESLNPLAEYHSYTSYHILVAFEFSEDAYTASITPEIGVVGYAFNAADIGGKCGGRAIVLVNEISSAEVGIVYAESTWSFFSPMSVRSSSYVGSIELVDRSSLLFADRIKAFAEEMGMSIHHLTIGWATVFSCRRSQQADPELLFINPLHFHITRFTQSISGSVGRSYIMEFAASYNTHGLLPQFSKLYQTTITHKDGNTWNTIPTPDIVSQGIVSRMLEDSLKFDKRKNRLNKSKNMKTIGDVMDGLHVELDGQKFEHKKQLQRYMTMINEQYTDLIEKVEQQKGVLPIDYRIDLDSYYKPMKIDNRNLPFEQYEIDQRVQGMSSITVPFGSSINSAIDLVFKMSKAVAEDHMKPQVKTFKITTSTNITCEKRYLINVKIRPYIVPLNSSDSYSQYDSAPGESSISGKVLNYVFQDPDKQNQELQTVAYSTSPDYKLSPMELTKEEDDAQSVFGNREPVTSERNQKIKDFFKRAFSGVRAIKSIFYENGLEQPTKAAHISNFNHMQQTTYVLSIRGNPHLLNDINRNCLDVIQDVETGSNPDGSGKYKIYKNIETDPMYVHLKVFLKGDQDLGVEKSKEPERLFYYESYLHMYKITNIFEGGHLSQHLTCGRTEEGM